MTIKKNKDKQAFYNHQDNLKIRLAAIICSFIIGIALMTVKFYVYKLTLSSAILSDAFESIINVVASGFAIISVIFASKPPDKSHPYGHGKIEYFSAGFEGALIILAAFGIFKVGISHIFTAQEIQHLPKGLILLSGAGIINFAMGMTLLKIGKKSRSFTLIADGKHLLSDVYTSVGILLGLLMVHLTGKYWMDGVIACIVGIIILYTGAVLVRRSFSGLMDASDPELLQEMAELLKKNRKNTWIDVHALRAIRSGNFIHTDFHIILPRDFSLAEAHDETVTLEKVIRRNFGENTSVLVHMDPCTDLSCPICYIHRCDLRKMPQMEEIDWNMEKLIRNKNI